MCEQSFGFLDEVLRLHLGPVLSACSHISRADVERLLTDDTHRRVRRARAAAAEWAVAEGVGQVEITSERLLITPRGLVYSARLSGSGPGSGRLDLHYLAIPPFIFDEVADRLGGVRLPRGSMAAMDGRLRRELEFPWPLDGALRRTLDVHRALLTAVPQPRRSDSGSPVKGRQPEWSRG